MLMRQQQQHAMLISRSLKALPGKQALCRGASEKMLTRQGSATAQQQVLTGRLAVGAFRAWRTLTHKLLEGRTQWWWATGRSTARSRM